MTPDEKRRIQARPRISAQGTIIALMVVSLSAIIGIGIYSAYDPSGSARASCVARFNALDALDENDKLEYQEYLTDREGLTREDFAQVDKNSDRFLSKSEFCNWNAERG